MKKFITILTLSALFTTLAFASGRSFRPSVDICKLKPELEKCKK